MRVKWKRMICGRPALIVIQMQRGEKAVMFTMRATTNGPGGRCATTPGLSSMGGGSLLKPAGKQVLTKSETYTVS